MNKLHGISIALIVLSWTGAAYSQPPACSGEGKFLYQSGQPDGTVGRANLSSIFDRYYKTPLMDEKIKALSEQYTSEMKKIKEKNKQQWYSQRANKELGEKREEFVVDLMRDIEKGIYEFGQKENFKEIANDRCTSQGIDVTQRIIDHLNARKSGDSK